MPSFSETLSALNVVQVAGGSKSLFAGGWDAYQIVNVVAATSRVLVVWDVIVAGCQRESQLELPTCSDGGGEDLRLRRGHQWQARPGPV